MKYLDRVKVINDNYKDEGITKGMIGTIIDPDIRWNCFYVGFIDQRIYDKEFMSKEENIFKLNSDICTGIKIEDLKLFEDSNVSDEYIRADLPKDYKDWWCKVEDGYIINLKGERKNKIPYDYDS